MDTENVYAEDILQYLEIMQKVLKRTWRTPPKLLLFAVFFSFYPIFVEDLRSNIFFVMVENTKEDP
jgi:hypothetical protein